MASSKNYIKNSPTIIKKLYYGLVPFHKRYGKEYVNMSKFLKSTLEYTPNQLKEYQLNKLRQVVTNAYDNVPYYHKLMVDYGVKRIITTPSDIKKLPLLTKQLVRDNWGDLINQKYNGKPLLFKTSGSTGQKFQFLGDDNLYKREAAFVHRAFSLHNAKLYNSRTVWVRRYAPKFGDPISYTDYELDRTYLSPFNVSADTIKSYVNEINKTKAKTLVTYPSLANFMATLMKEQNLYFDNITSIHCASEMILPEWRDNVYNSIGIKLYAHYGMMEKVSFFCNTLNDNRYAENLEYGYTEIINNEVIGTGFLNDVMPLIRYSPGDKAIVDTTGDNFLSLPITVKDFIGRSTDMIETPDGRKLAGVNFYTMMYKIPGVEMFQIIQKSLNCIEVQYIKSSKFNNQTKQQIQEGMIDRVGNCNLIIKPVEKLKRSKSGKFKTIKNEL
jgi:phenylacetate-CoA ligase